MIHAAKSGITASGLLHCEPLVQSLNASERTSGVSCHTGARPTGRGSLLLDVPSTLRLRPYRRWSKGRNSPSPVSALPRRLVRYAHATRMIFYSVENPIKNSITPLSFSYTDTERQLYAFASMLPPEGVCYSTLAIGNCQGRMRSRVSHGLSTK